MENTIRQNLQGFSTCIQGSLCKEFADGIIRSKEISTTKEEKPYRRGYYTGAFDMFHYGHLLGIQNALNYCDQLIVAVSTDEVIRDYKHRDPVIPFEQRLAIVSAIKGVSIAIPQYDLYNKMGPAQMLDCDVIFTSSEYQRSEYEGKEMTPKEQAGVERWELFEEQSREIGMNIVYLPRTDSVSTTEIKERVITQYSSKSEYVDISNKSTHDEESPELTDTSFRPIDPTLEMLQQQYVNLNQITQPVLDDVISQ